MPLKLLDAVGSGSDSDAMECIDYAIDKRANVINASWGDKHYSDAVREAISQARNRGIIFVAAAGNTFNDPIVDNDQSPVPFNPASYDVDNIVAVAATDRNDALWEFSHYGLVSVD